MSFAVTTKEGEELVAVDKGYIDGKEIVKVEDGRMFRNDPAAGLVEYEDAAPISMVDETTTENEDAIAAAIAKGIEDAAATAAAAEDESNQVVIENDDSSTEPEAEAA